MMFLTIALIGQAHGFEPLLTGQLEAQGISCLAMPGLDASLEERATLAIIADTPPRARAIDVLHVLRRRSDLPCIIVLPRGHRDIDRILTLEAGADDWIDQGARMRELLAHIRAVLRRQRGLGSTPAPPRPHGWQLCARRRELFDASGLPRGLTPSEFELLRLLVMADGCTLPREELCRRVFGRNHHPEDRAVDNLVVRLRRKVETDPRNPQLIRSARPVGYFFADVAAARPLMAAE